MAGTLWRLGFAIVDAAGRTSTGVWAAGICREPRSKMITSAGAGCAAAIAINTHLVLDDVERADRRRPRPSDRDSAKYNDLFECRNVSRLHPHRQSPEPAASRRPRRRVQNAETDQMAKSRSVPTGCADGSRPLDINLGSVTDAR